MANDFNFNRNYFMGGATCSRRGCILVLRGCIFYATKRPKAVKPAVSCFWLDINFCAILELDCHSPISMAFFAMAMGLYPTWPSKPSPGMWSTSEG